MSATGRARRRHPARPPAHTPTHTSTRPPAHLPTCTHPPTQLHPPTHPPTRPPTGLAALGLQHALPGGCLLVTPGDLALRPTHLATRGERWVDGWAPVGGWVGWVGGWGAGRGELQAGHLDTRVPRGCDRMCATLRIARPQPAQRAQRTSSSSSRSRLASCPISTWHCWAAHGACWWEGGVRRGAGERGASEQPRRRSHPPIGWVQPPAHPPATHRRPPALKRTHTRTSMYAGRSPECTDCTRICHSAASCCFTSSSAGRAKRAGVEGCVCLGGGERGGGEGCECWPEHPAHTNPPAHWHPPTHPPTHPPASSCASTMRVLARAAMSVLSCSSALALRSSTCSLRASESQ